MAAGIYKITNLVNGKFYIGSSSRLNARKAEHKYKRKNHKGNSIIRNAVMKYGEESFSFDILETIDADSYSEKSELNEILKIREKFFIDLLKPDYNIRLIDVTRNIGVCSEKQREHLKKIANRPRDPEVYRRLSLTLKGKYIGEKNKNSIKIDVYSYPSLIFVETITGVRDCERKYGILSTTVSQVCKRGLSENSKFKSNYVFRYHGEAISTLFRKKKINKGYQRKNTIPVIQVDENGNFIKEWRTGKDAETELNLHKGSVSRVISGEYRHTKNYYFIQKT